MQKIFRTYAHSKRASWISVAGVVLSILLVIGAIVSLVICVRTENAVSFAVAIAGIALSVFCYRYSGRFADKVALYDLEKELGKPLGKI